MKKFLVLVAAFALAAGLVACGKDNADEGNNPPIEDNQTGNVSDSQDVPDEGSNQEDVFDNANSGMTNLKDAVVEVLGENYWPNTPIPAEVLEGTYGISADMYDDFFGEMPMISTNVDTLLIIKAKDDQIQAVSDALNAYRDKQIQDGMQYPMNVGKVQASRIETIGNYVCFAQLGADTTAISEQGDEAVIEYCQQENEKALDAIEQTLAQ